MIFCGSNTLDIEYLEDALFFFHRSSGCETNTWANSTLWWIAFFLHVRAFRFISCCSMQPQSVIDKLLFCRSITSLTALQCWHWFIAPFSIILYLPHNLKSDTVCNQRWVWVIIHTHRCLSPLPHIYISFKGILTWSCATVTRLGPREEFDDLTQE